jgi:hypothetical protein
MKGLLKWFGAHKVITGILILVLFVIAVTNGSKSNTTSNTVPSTSSTQPSATQAPAPAPAKTEAKAATRQPAGTATTQGAGTFTGGQDVAVGLYDVTPGAGQSGNFSVSGNDSYNEILGGDSSTGGVPSVKVTLTKGDKINISSLSAVTFTPSN